ncbi:MAG: MlaD family protein, partial [Microcystaceae cyanobacterium]
MLNARTLREGTVGLFALLGLVLVGGVAIWLRGGSFGNQGYRIFVGFDDASGLQVGAPVRFRGVAVGKVSALNPSSNGIEAALDFASTQLKIPLDSVIQITRYGLIGEASIDITPSRKLSPEALTIDPTSQD